MNNEVNFTAHEPPEAAALPTTLLQLAEWIPWPGVYPVRLGWARVGRLSYEQRVFWLVLLQDLEESGRTLHWSAVMYAFNAHLAVRHPKRKPMTVQRFWEWLYPLALAGVVHVVRDPRSDAA